MGKSKELAELGQVVSQNGGNVGISIDNPAHLVSVNSGTTSSGVISLGALENTTDPRIYLTADPVNGNTSVTSRWSHPLNLNTNNTTRMTIDAAGRVTMPYQPAFDVATTNVTAINNYIVFNVAYVNRGNHFNTSTGAFTAPVSGAYHFTYSTIKDGGSTNEVGRFVLTKNGVVMNGSRELRLDIGQEYGDNGSQVWIVQMNAGDYVNIKVGSTSNSSNYGGTAYNGFTGYLIG